MDALSKGAASLGGGVASLGSASTSLATKGLKVVGDKSTGVAKAVLQTAKQELSTIWQDVSYPVWPPRVAPSLINSIRPASHLSHVPFVSVLTCHLTCAPAGYKSAPPQS